MNQQAQTTPVSPYGGTIAEKYERFFVPTIGRPLADDLIAAAAPRPGERVLDVGCGTGLLARLAASLVGRSGAVAGVDPNPGMLEVARATNGTAPRIEWYEAGAESMPFPDASFDLVLCQMALQFVTDRPVALREMHRVLTRGGRLALNVPGPIPDALADLATALQNEIGPEAAGFARAVFALSDPDELRDLLAGAGFRDIEVHAAPRRIDTPPPRDFLWQYVHSTPLAPRVLQAPDDKRQALESEVTSRWQRFAANGGMAIDVGMTTVTASK